jgi:hypothetical protein
MMTAILKQSIKKRYIYEFARSYISLVMAKNDEAVCLAHGAQNSSSLTTSQAYAWFAIGITPQDGALKFCTTGFLRIAASEIA